MMLARTLAVGLMTAFVLAGARGERAAVATGPTVSPALLSVATPAPPARSRDLGVPMKTEPRTVAVVLAKGSFKEGEAIRAAVANGMPSTIFTEDSKTDCSIVFLERWDGGTWRPVPGCALGRAPIIVAIGSGLGRFVTLNPMSIHLRGDGPPTSKPAIRAGMYRIRFTYRLGRDPEGIEPLTSLSQPFIIRP